MYSFAILPCLLIFCVSVIGLQSDVPNGLFFCMFGSVLAYLFGLVPAEPSVFCFSCQRWALGAVFIPDSAGYLLASVSGAWWVAVGAERVAVSAVACVGLAALALPHAPSVITH